MSKQLLTQNYLNILNKHVEKRYHSQDKQELKNHKDSKLNNLGLVRFCNGDKEVEGYLLKELENSFVSKFLDQYLSDIILKHVFLETDSMYLRGVSDGKAQLASELLTLLHK